MITEKIYGNRWKKWKNDSMIYLGNLLIFFEENKIDLSLFKKIL